MKTPLNKLETIALSVTKSIGSIWSVIIHTIIFILSFSLVLFGIPIDRVLLVLTTILSLEAIYLSIFIQMSVNYQSRALANVEHDIDEIAEDVGEIHDHVEEMQEDVEGIAEDVGEIQEAHEEIQEDIEEIQKDVDEIQSDVDEIQKDVDEIQEDVEEIAEDVDGLQEEIDVVDEKIDHNRHL
jgi:peptidoglycan hydrolase CwlO-like protein